MWYFAWILGVGFACCFAVLNAMWLELEADARHGPPPASGADAAAEPDRPTRR